MKSAHTAAMLLLFALQRGLPVPHVREYVAHVAETLECRLPPRPAGVNSMLHTLHGMLITRASQVSRLDALPPALGAHLRSALQRVKESGALQDSTASAATTLQMVVDRGRATSASYLAIHARTCAACGARETRVEEFKLCSACKRAAYCGKDCQAAHWRQHKAACKAARAAAAKGGASGSA